jgi:hypothetical protein
LSNSSSFSTVYNRFNFHKHTFCIFKEVKLEEFPSLPIHYKSKSGSQYSFTEKGVFRISNHWGRASNCRWRLVTSSSSNASSSSKINNSQSRIGYADWTDFYPNNETEKLFYITIDWETRVLNFMHCHSPQFNNKTVVRTASETAKRIKQIQEVLKDKQWAKHLNFDDYDQLEKEVVEELITTNLSFLEIKRKFQ